MLPAGLVSNLQQVLQNRKPGGDDNGTEELPAPIANAGAEPDSSKPVILVTNGDGIESAGLTFLVEALVQQGLYNVNVCAPRSDKSSSAHSLTIGESVAVTYFDINGATAYEVSGTPVDCVSLALSGALFSWSKPLLVISGINPSSNCGHNMFYSGAVAGAREALINGVPSISISLNWKKDESKESDFKDAVTVCLPLITSAIRDIEKGVFVKNCFLNIEVPTSPSSNKGFKLTKQSIWRSRLSWLAVSSNRNPAARYMGNQQSLGLQLAQLGRDASAAGAARKLGTQKQSLEVVESVGVAGKSDPDRKQKYFKLQLEDKEHKEEDGDFDFKALENGFVTITPVSVLAHVETEIQEAASEWLSAALKVD